MKARSSQSVQEIEMIVEYFDKTVDSISVTSNLEELEKLVSSSFGTGASMNFTSATPPFSINPRWVRKIGQNKEDTRRIVMFKLVTMAFLLVLAYGIGLVMLEMKNAPLMDDEKLSSPNNEGDK